MRMGAGHLGLGGFAEARIGVLALMIGAGACEAFAQGGAALPDSVPAGVPVLVLGSNLKVVQGRLTSLDFQGGATIVEASGKTQKFEPGRAVALVAADVAADPLAGFGAYAAAAERGAPDASLLTRALLARRGGLLVTTLGERITGKLRVADVSMDHLGWSSVRLGVFEVPLESVSSARISLTDADGSDSGLELAVVPQVPLLPSPGAGADDAVVLFNGDTVRGLITKVGANIGVETDGGKVSEFEASRVAGVVLANPVKGLSGPTIWLADGSVLTVKAMVMDRTPRGPAVRIESVSGAKGVVPLAEVRGWSPSPERFTALSGLEIKSVKALGGRFYAPTPSPTAHADDLGMPGIAALGASDLVFVGGVEVTIALPKSAKRLVGTVALDDDAGEWGDCEVVISSGNVPAVRVHLSEEQPAAELNAALGGGEVSVRVEGGRFGTVKDRVRLMRGLVLVGE